jgi:hypothetical protein
MTTYTTKQNAIRGFKRANQALADKLDNAAILATYIVENEDGSFGWAIPADVKRTFIYKGVQLRRRSLEPEGITSMVHDMFAEYEAEAEEKGITLKRKDFIAKAVRDGVAYYTARTQYQKYLRG